ncbi:PREDICTED: uncharacterized protein LOC101298943 [Fragaria vesca subsp. vesca]
MNPREESRPFINNTCVRCILQRELMAGVMLRIPVTRLTADNILEFPGGRAASLSDMVLGFIEEPAAATHAFQADSMTSGSDEEEEDQAASVEENKAFWDEQHQLLQATLHRTSSIESKIRQATKEVLRETIDSTCCRCSREVAGDCRNCLQSEICNRLISLGYNCAICKSKWKSSASTPSGEHTYLEVLDNSNPKRGETRVVIELNFRAEFEMARASQDYNRLISFLPEVFVGKAERLRALIKILCNAAKKCMKEKKMHLGPWRKHKYMQAKWFAAFQRSTPGLLQVGGCGNRPPKPRASMLTFDLSETMPGFHFTAVEAL